MVDFTHIWAGPYCTRILADLGAEVIKVESPRRGDGGRGKGVGRYHAYSRNKLAIAMDLRTEEGQRHIRKLISVSDVVVENFSVGVTGRLGVDYEDCRAITPGIVYVALPAFGRTGPESGFVGHGSDAGGDVGAAQHQQLPGSGAKSDGCEVRRPERRDARGGRGAGCHPPPGCDRGRTANRPVAARGQHLHPSRD